MMRPGSGSTLTRWLAGSAMVCGLLASSAGTLDAQEISAPLSGGLSDPVSGSIYTENSQYGPSTSIVVGANNLGTPYLHIGISDPLEYLLESGDMTPLPAGGQMVGGYADTGVLSEVPNDSTVAERFSEYQANFGRMSGAGARSMAAAHAQAASSGPGRSSMIAGGSGGFSGGGSARLSALAPFAAGSNGLANSRDLSVLGGQAVSAGAAPADIPGLSVPAMESEGAAPGSVGGSGVSSDGAASGSISSGAALQSAGSAGAGLLVGPATQNPLGQQPGSIFPDLSSSSSAGSGFPDSTMGTAGLASDSQLSLPSPLLSGKFSGVLSPFRSISGEETRYLNPSLSAPPPAAGASAAPGASDDSGAGAGMSMSELRRKARLKAMVDHPNDPLPSPFQQREIEKDYLRQTRNGGRARRVPSVIVPSVTH